MLRVCIVAEHASYRFGGEASLPLQYFSRLRSRGLEVWLVVHSRTRSELEATFPRDRRIVYVEDAWFHKLLFRLSCLLPRRVAESTLGLMSQLITQLLARRVVRRLVVEHAIDVVHQPIPVSPRFPSAMVHLGAPVIIGPMNGGMQYPSAFRHEETPLARLWIALGRSLSGLANLLIRGKKEARVLLVANERTRTSLPINPKGEILELAENGVDLPTWSPVIRQAQTCGNKFIFIGRLVDWKKVDVAIEAMAAVPEAKLDIIGEGPMRRPWEALSKQRALEGRIHFLGWLPQSECAAALSGATGLMLPSIYESGGAVVLEAMAAGVPVIATDWGGPPNYIDRNCGILIHPAGYEEMIAGFANAIRQLIVNPRAAWDMGRRGMARVQADFDWEKKIDRIISIYYSAQSPYRHGDPAVGRHTAPAQSAATATPEVPCP